MNEPVYWTMKDGQKINVDDMDIGHLRNTLKLLIRNNTPSKRVSKAKEIYPHGEMAQDFNDTQESLEFLDCGDDPWLWD